MVDVTRCEFLLNSEAPARVAPTGQTETARTSDTTSACYLFCRPYPFFNSERLNVDKDGNGHPFVALSACGSALHDS